jgi:acetyl-CoA carboxylase carboxyl transferase subunit alpha
MADLRVPIVSIVIGEGGSGGALAIGLCDRLLMLQYAVYSVISPEGCASILWKSAERATDAAESMGMTTRRLKALGLVDEVVAEPLGGAHRDLDATVAAVEKALLNSLVRFDAVDLDELLRLRYRRFREFGRYDEAS